MKLLRSIVAEATMLEGSFSSSVIRHGPGIGVRFTFLDGGGGGGASGALAVAAALAARLRSSRGGTAWMRRATIDVTVASPKRPPKIAVMRGESCIVAWARPRTPMSRVGGGGVE